MSKLLTCPECNKLCIGHGNLKFCSVDCRESAYSRKISDRRCLQCSKFLTAQQKAVKNKYCSMKCAGMLQGKLETIWKHDSIRGAYDVWVRNEKGQPWRRKVSVVLERVLGRRLHGNEAKDVVFLDGDRLNCTPDNLFLAENKGLAVCRFCGTSKIKTTSRILKSRGVRGVCACRVCAPVFV